VVADEAADEAEAEAEADEAVAVVVAEEDEEEPCKDKWRFKDKCRPPSPRKKCRN
jgi:hypothetical protein